MSKKFFSILTIVVTVFGLFTFVDDASAAEGTKTKSAYNRTQGRNAEDGYARAGDLIEYTLVFESTRSGTQNVIIEDNISNVLELADVNNYNGATLSGNILRFPESTVPSYGRLEKTFVVRIKDLDDSSSRTMSNTYGDTVDISVYGSGSVGTIVNRSKSAYNVTQGRNAESAAANPGDIIEYTLTYEKRYGGSRAEVIEDDISDVLEYAYIDSISNNGYVSGSYVRFPSVTISPGQTVSRTFRVKIRDLTTYSGDLYMRNTYGNQVSIQVTPGGSSGSGTVAGRSKSAYNQTQNRDAEEVYAKPGDFITYTLSYYNDSYSTQVVAIEDDISDVLYLSDVTNYGGASLSGNVLRFPSVSVPSRTRIDRTFQVRVKNVPSGTADTTMSNYFGNGVDIKVSTTGGVIYKDNGVVKGETYYIPPKTGPAENFALWFSLLLTAGIYVNNKLRRKKAAAISL